MPTGIVIERRTATGVVSLDCVNRVAACIAQGDDASIDFLIVDSEGNPFPVSSVTAARFIVSEGQEFAGSMYAGGDIYFTLTLGAGIAVVGDNTLRVTVSGVNSALVETRRNYMQLQINVGAARYTVAAGLYQSEFTQ